MLSWCVRDIPTRRVRTHARPPAAVLARTAFNIRVGATNRASGMINSISLAILAIALFHIAKFLPLPCVGGMVRTPPVPAHGARRAAARADARSSAAQVCCVAARLVKLSEFQVMWHGDKVCARGTAPRGGGGVTRRRELWQPRARARALEAFCLRGAPLIDAASAHARLFLRTR